MQIFAADRFRLVAALVALAVLPAMPSLAQDSAIPASSAEQSTVPEELQTMVGDFILEQEDETLPKCPITFTADQAIGGWAVVFPETCPAPYPAADSIVAWNVDDSDGSITLLDAERHITLRLFEDEDGLFDTPPDSNPRFVLLAPYEQDGNGGEDDSDD
jgi:hypothetical protein